jgi:multisubunit Na+/H+ antiporter MnhB subunit
MPKAKSRWDIGLLAVYGALLGLLLGMMEQFCHAFCPASWHYTVEGDLFTHVLVEFVAFAVAGATLLAATAAIRNWLVGAP